MRTKGVFPFVKPGQELVVCRNVKGVAKNGERLWAWREVVCPRRTNIQIETDKEDAYQECESVRGHRESKIYTGFNVMYK